MPKVQLVTAHDEFHELHKQVDSNVKTVRVDAQALRNLLIDHSRMCEALRGVVVLPVAKRARPVID